MRIHTSLGMLEVEDLLVGPKCPQHRYLASSRLPGAAAAAEVGAGEDLFFDAEESAAQLGSSPQRSTSLSSAAGNLSPRPSATGAAGPGSSQGQDLAEFTFQIRRPGAPDYEGVDSSLDISLRQAMMLPLPRCCPHDGVGNRVLVRMACL